MKLTKTQKKEEQINNFLSIYIFFVFGVLIAAIAGTSEPIPEPKTSPYQHFVISEGPPLTVYRNELGQLLTCRGEEVTVERENLIPTNDRCW